MGTMHNVFVVRLPWMTPSRLLAFTQVYGRFLRSHRLVRRSRPIFSARMHPALRRLV